MDTALKHSISTTCPVCKEISNGRSRAQCVNPVMSKHFHYCSWQIWQLLSSNAELQLHLKGVWIETDYLGRDSELSLLSAQCNLVRFDGGRLETGGFCTRRSQKTVPANAAARAAFSENNQCPTTCGTGQCIVVSEHTGTQRNGGLWGGVTEEMASELQRWWGKWFQP